MAPRRCPAHTRGSRSLRSPSRSRPLRTHRRGQDHRSRLPSLIRSARRRSTRAPACLADTRARAGSPSAALALERSVAVGDVGARHGEGEARHLPVRCCVAALAAQQPVAGLAVPAAHQVRALRRSGRAAGATKAHLGGGAGSAALPAVRGREVQVDLTPVGCLAVAVVEARRTGDDSAQASDARLRRAPRRRAWRVAAAAVHRIGAGIDAGRATRHERRHARSDALVRDAGRAPRADATALAAVRGIPIEGHAGPASAPHLARRTGGQTHGVHAGRPRAAGPVAAATVSWVRGRVDAGAGALQRAADAQLSALASHARHRSRADVPTAAAVHRVDVRVDARAATARTGAAPLSYRAEPVDTGALLAIAGEAAGAADRAARARSSAVDVGLEAVRDVIGARRVDAAMIDAGAAVAVSRVKTKGAAQTRSAVRAAAVQIGLQAVDSAVSAARRSAATLEALLASGAVGGRLTGRERRLVEHDAPRDHRDEERVPHADTNAESGTGAGRATSGPRSESSTACSSGGTEVSRR